MKVKNDLIDMQNNQTIFTCSICDQITGDPTYTDMGLACEDCLDNGKVYYDDCDGKIDESPEFKERNLVFGR